ncbi:hydrolase [Streptomyces sp. R35]|uniref:Hydrolase n=1 Tax=Streptomyces sp. R35 TaxID=3238630 RepID=A0AB39S066_9ACTN
MREPSEDELSTPHEGELSTLNESELPLRLPERVWTTPYVGRRFPGSRSVAEKPGLTEGANCQFFAYEVLRHFGLDIPAWRSSDLWADTELTERVRVPRPLDLALFNADDTAWGAHVGVAAGEGKVLHLCREAGRPAVWTLEEFTARERYRTLLGFKRVRPGRA